MPELDAGDNGHAELTYFYDFIEKIKTDYPYASLMVILEEIAFAREVGPALAGLLIDSGVYTMNVPIGFGHKAIIELEYDKNKRLQPVMGGIIKD